MRRTSGERGQVVPLVATVLAVAALCAIGLGRLGGEASRRAGVQSVADMAALAGATGGSAAAHEVVAANGASLVAFAEADPFVQVEVSRAGHRARATAERLPEPLAGADATPPGAVEVGRRVPDEPPGGPARRASVRRGPPENP